MTATVGFDARMWHHPGIGRYIRELLKHLLPQRSEFRFRVLGPAAVGDVARAWSHAEFVPSRSAIYGIHEQLELLSETRHTDLLHVPHFNIPVFRGGALVVTVHDLIYLKYPSASRFGLARAAAAFFLNQVRRKARAVIAVSEHTKSDLLEKVRGFREDKIFVIHEAASPAFRKLADRSQVWQAKLAAGLTKPYVFFVGTLKKHKNLPLLVEAFRRCRKKAGWDYELAVVGRRDPADAWTWAAASGSPFVRYLGTVPDELLALLYNGAELVALPSLDEGFGLPLLEAMACGTPVLASNRGSFPEIGGDAAVYFDPTNVDALTNALYNTLNNKELQTSMSRKGLERAKTFSWDKAAQKTLEIYAQCL